MSNNWTRLEALERKSPEPFEPHESHWIVVEPTPDGGPPIRCGCTQRWTSQAHRGGMVEIFDPPCPDGKMPPSLTPTQIHQINEFDDARGSNQRVQVRRRANGSGTIILLEAGRDPRELMELLPND